MITVDKLTDEMIRSRLLYPHTFCSPAWLDAEAALKGDQAARVRCADRINAYDRHQEWARNFYAINAAARSEK